MKVIALVRRTIDGVTYTPGGEPFDLENSLAHELIAMNVVEDANPAPPPPAAPVEEIVYPVGYVGRQLGPDGEPVTPPPPEPEPFTSENPAPRPAEMPAALDVPATKKKAAPRA